MTSASERETILVAGREITITNPDKVLFPLPGFTKRDLARYYLAVADGALRGAGGRPNVLVRYPNGVAGEFFYQKRAPKTRPAWLDTVELSFPSGRTALETVPRDAAALAWMANLACLELHPHPVRAEDVDHPDELRVDLDPVPGVEWRQVREVAVVVRAVLEDVGLTGWPKTSGSRGMHVFIRIQPRWTFDEVRRAALALAREVERRAPSIATSRWWKEERHGVFIDYNQNAKDRTVASAYSVRPTADARVSAPLSWNEVEGCDPAEFTLASVPERYARIGDPHAGMDEHAGSIDALLELAARQEAGGRTSAPERPLIEIGLARKKDDALAGFERWKARHPDAARYLQPADILVDAMRGRHRTWTRVRINLEHVPADCRPAQEPLDPDENMADEWRGMVRDESALRRRSSRARKES